jgi:hypothetical protein
MLDKCRSSRRPATHRVRASDLLLRRGVEATGCAGETAQRQLGSAPASRPVRAGAVGLEAQPSDKARPTPPIGTATSTYCARPYGQTATSSSPPSAHKDPPIQQAPRRPLRRGRHSANPRQRLRAQIVHSRHPPHTLRAKPTVPLRAPAAAAKRPPSRNAVTVIADCQQRPRRRCWSAVPPSACLRCPSAGRRNVG